MPSIFPSLQWVKDFDQKLNTDPQYAQIAKKWEGDITFTIEPSGPVTETVYYYFDLWHGTCRKAEVLNDLSIKSAFVLTAPYENFVKILKGEIEPMTAMLTRKLSVQGNMAVMMRSIPVVLDFVRCARENTSGFLT
jgi:putative sterol carrier protein